MPPVPAQPKLYHIVHHDRLPSIIARGALLSDAAVRKKGLVGTGIGYQDIKNRRLVNQISCCPGLAVGACVPFYFCPRSVMLYVISRGNSGLAYADGQGPIVTLEFDLHTVRQDAEANGRRWAFTTSNAGANVFQDFGSVAELDHVRWDIINERYWTQPDVKTAKQSEFLVEGEVPWQCVERIGGENPTTLRQVANHLQGSSHRPVVQHLPQWYY